MRRLLFIPALLALVACGSSSETADDDGAANDQDVVAASTTCSHDQYNAALASYKLAVAGSKARLAHGACEDDGAYATDIVGNAEKAIATCGAFKSVLANSPYAKPVRDALKDNLAIAAVTGKLDTAKWSGLDESLVGVTMWGPAPGVYGNMSKIEFKAAHGITVSQLVVNDNDGSVKWVGQNGTYKIGAKKADGSIPISLHYGNPGAVDVTYDLSEDKDQKGVFHMKPSGSSSVPPSDFLSVPSECEA